MRFLGGILALLFGVGIGGWVGAAEVTTRPAFTRPAGAVVAMELQFKDVPAETVLKTVAEKMGIVLILSPGQMGENRITVESGKAVDAWEAIDLLQESFLGTGCGLLPSVTSANKDGPGRLIVRVVNMTEAEARRYLEERRLPALPKVTTRPGISATATITFEAEQVSGSVLVKAVADRFGYELVTVGSAGNIQLRVTPKVKEPLRAEDAVAALDAMVGRLGYTAFERVNGEKTELRVMTIGEAKKEELEARRAMTRPK